MKIFTNWCPTPLRKALENYGVKIDVVKTSSILHILSQYEAGCDLCYFARFAPPLIDKDLFRIGKTGIPIIYGFHAPLKVDYPVRPSHYLYNLVMPMQAMRAASISKKLHFLNLDDIKLINHLDLATKSIYLPLGVDVNIFKIPVTKSERFTVIYASRASWNKGTDILVRLVIPYFTRKLPDIRIDIVSYGFLSHLYKGLKGMKNIRMIPFLPPIKFAEVLASAHVLLFPSRYESFGLVVLEALACGTIPVAFNIRGFVRDILSRDSIFKEFVVNYSRPERLALKVIELYKLWSKKPENFYSLVRRARNLALKFSWKNVAQVWLRAFKEVTEEC